MKSLSLVLPLVFVLSIFGCQKEEIIQIVEPDVVGSDLFGCWEVDLFFEKSTDTGLVETYIREELYCFEKDADFFKDRNRNISQAGDTMLAGSWIIEADPLCLNLIVPASSFFNVNSTDHKKYDIHFYSQDSIYMDRRFKEDLRTRDSVGGPLYIFKTNYYYEEISMTRG